MRRFHAIVRETATGDILSVFESNHHADLPRWVMIAHGGEAITVTYAHGAFRA